MVVQSYSINLSLSLARQLSVSLNQKQISSFVFELRLLLALLDVTFADKGIDLFQVSLFHPPKSNEPFLVYLKPILSYRIVSLEHKRRSSSAFVEQPVRRVSLIHITNYNSSTNQSLYKYHSLTLSSDNFLNILNLILKIITITAMDCYYHPKNPLQNFCNNPSCALPLCPKCINIHLSQVNCTHEIITLNEAIDMSSQQLETSFTGLTHELKSLKQDYQPHNVLKDYTNVLTKFRQEAIDEINKHYDYLQRELLSQISSRYAQHLQSLVIPIQEQLIAVDKARTNIKKHDKSVQTLIRVVSEQRVSAVQQILKKSKEKKVLFKNQLPRLQDAEGGRLKMASQRLQVTSDRYSSVIIPPAANPSIPALAGLDRIAQLEARLHALRYGE